MKKSLLLIGVGMLLAFAAQQSSAATTLHVSGGVATSLTDAITAAVAGDTIMIDDSLLYDFGTGSTPLALAKAIRIVAATGTTPTIKYTGGTNTTSWFIRFDVPGIQLGSSAAGENGRITLDGGNNIGRYIGISTAVIWPVDQFGTTTIENVVIQGVNDGRNTGAKYFWGINCGGWNTTQTMNGNNIINVRNVEFKLPATQPMTAGQKVGAMTFGLDNGAVCNIENVKCNGSRGYILDIGSGSAYYAAAGGTVNIKNCQFYQDQFSTSPLVQAPIQTGGYSPLNGIGYEINIDNSFIRTDALHTSQIAAWTTRDSETSNSLGCITLCSTKRNNLTITNSALVGVGAVIAVETTASQIRCTNSDLYVNAASSVSDGTPSGKVTPGYFLNMSHRVAYTGNHQTTMTRCNLYGLAGSFLDPAFKQTSDRFVMVSCNDWSPVNAYAEGWITTNCVMSDGVTTQTHGMDPGYGAMSGTPNMTAALNGRDFTVYNKTISALNIGSNRDFNAGVPVELSTFQVR